MPSHRYRMDQEAVSPVIGVILMVAITVVLAGVVFVLLNGIGSKSTKDTPTPVFQMDDVSDRLSIVSATTGADWTRVQVTATQCTTGGFIAIGGTGGSPHQNQPTTSASSTAISSGGCSGINPKIQITTVDAPIIAGDFIAFCSSTSATNVDVQLIDTLSNTVLGTFRFTNIHSPC